MSVPKMKVQVVSVQFTKEDHALLAHLQMMPGSPPMPAGPGTPASEGTEPTFRWLFNMQQIAAQNGLSIPEEGVTHEYYAETDRERDEIAEKLLDAVIAGRKKSDELAKQVTDAFVKALPQFDSTAPAAE